MTASVARISSALRVGSTAAWFATVLVLCAGVAVAGTATRLGMLPTALALALAAVGTLVSVRWPLLPLIAFAVLIPLEDFLVIDGLGTISRLVGILFAVTYGVPRAGRLVFAAMPLGAWAYVAWAVLSLFWAYDANTAWGALPTLLQFMLMAVLVADLVVQRPTVVRPLLWAYSVSAATAALLAIGSFVTSGSADGRAEAIASQGPAQFAAVLLPAAVFGLYEVINARQRLFGGAIAMLTIAGIVVSGTRGAWLALAVVVGLFIIPRLRPRRQLAAIVTVVVVLFLTLQLPGVANLVDERAATAASSGGAGRTDIWQVGVTIYWTSPVVGVGYANFGVAYTRDMIIAADVAYAGARKEGRGSHSLIVGTLAELGLIGLVLLATFLLPLVLRPGWGPEAATVQAALASLLTSALFLDILSNRKQVWLFIAFAAGLRYLAKRSRMRSTAPDGSSADGLPRVTHAVWVTPPDSRGTQTK